MAGNLSDRHLKSIPRCHHGSMCVLKTGTSKNASRGKSFFICNNTEGRCSYATLAPDFQATVCPSHEKLVELKAFAKKENGIRCYYRCVLGKEKGKTWCGHEIVLPAHPPQKNVLKDITNSINPLEKTRERRLMSATTKRAKEPITKLKDPETADEPVPLETEDTTSSTNFPQKHLLKDITNSINLLEKTKEHQLKSITTKAAKEPIRKLKDPETVDKPVTLNTNTVVTAKECQMQKSISIGLSEETCPQLPKNIPGRLASEIDLSKTSFTVARNTRISDISDASSVECNNSSRELCDEAQHDTHDDVIDSNMLSNNGALNESSDDVTASSADDFENPEVCGPSKNDGDKNNDGDKDRMDPDMSLRIVSGSESDDEKEEENGIEATHHTSDNDIVDSSMLSNTEGEIDEITDVLNSTSIHTNTVDICRSVPVSSSSNITNGAHTPDNDIADLSMLSNIEGEVDEITDVLNNTSIHTNAVDICDSVPVSSSSNITNVAVGKQKSNKNIIEISDSSDDEAEVRLDNICQQEVPRPHVHSAEVCPTKAPQTSNYVREMPPSHVLPINPGMYWNKVQSLKLQLSRQQEIYSRIGMTLPDGGRKLAENIYLLRAELEVAKKQFSDAQKAAYFTNSSHTLPINMHFPSTNNGAVEYADPHTLVPDFGYASHYRPTPLFGGRMTEKRLKEVGTITKNTIEQLHKSLECRPAPSEEAEDPRNLKVTLMTHQKQALAWLLWRERQIPPGGILADDMGLGKTLTMISLALKSKQDNLSQVRELGDDSKLIISKGSVIICPASLIHQWQKEVEKRVKDDRFSVYLYHGANREKRIKKLVKYDIILTTYNIASIEGKKFSIDEKAKPSAQLSEWHDSTQPKVPEEGPLFKIFWRRIILDEGHTIKNHKTACSIAICAMEGESRWIVTGTPIQNNTMELYSLIKFLRVTPFDEFKVWRREVDNKMTSGTKRMNSIVASLLLRRTKDQVDAKTGKPLIVLPKRTSTLHKLKLSKGELEVYELVQHYSKKIFKRFLDTRKDAVDGEPVDPTTHQEKESYEVPASILGIQAAAVLSMLGLHGANVVTQSCLLVMVLRLRQCCTHLSLMCEEIDPDLCQSEGIEVPLEEQLGNLSIDENKDSEPSRPREMLPTFLSSKISTLLSCLSDFKKQGTGKPIKSVIVSQWTRMLDIVAHHLKVAGYRFDYITGSVNVKKRSDIVDSFNNDRYPEIMLVSLKAGGVGLNLIGGTHLFLLDQHWNPALEDQASDRIYRVGQKNDVTVHRFLCVDTVEERIAALQEKKKALANSVLYGGKMAQKLTLADLKMIFGLGT